MNGAVSIARTSTIRLLRDRRALFFLVVLPIMVILIVGATVRGFSVVKVGVVDEGAGRAGQALTEAIERSPDLAVTRYRSVGDMKAAIARGEVVTGVVLPAGMTAAEEAGKAVQVPVFAEHTNSSMQAAAAAVEGVLTKEGQLVQAASFSRHYTGEDFWAALGRVATLAPTVPKVEVKTIEAQGAASTLPEGFSYSAPTELVLFVFISSVMFSATFIETRRLGIYERAMAAPVKARAIIAGETLRQCLVGVGQSVLIVAVGAIGFGVSWGDPRAAIVLITLWVLVGVGAGMLLGTLFRTPEQASALGPVMGIALGMLGGCMWPLSIVTATMRTIGHLTPHAWAIDAWTNLLSRGGDFSAIAGDLGVLALFAAGFLLLATVRLRNALA